MSRLPTQFLNLTHAKSWDRLKTRKGGLGNKQVVRKALGLAKIRH